MYQSEWMRSAVSHSFKSDGGALTSAFERDGLWTSTAAPSPPSSGGHSSPSYLKQQIGAKHTHTFRYRSEIWGEAVHGYKVTNELYKSRGNAVIPNTIFVVAKGKVVKFIAGERKGCVSQQLSCMNRFVLIVFVLYITQNGVVCV